MMLAPSLPPNAPQTSLRDGAVPPRRLAWNALGTPCSIQFTCEDADRAEAFCRAAINWVANFESRYSRFRSDSIVSRINAAAGIAPVVIDQEAEQMLDLCGSVHFMTQGLLDVTALPILRLWDYKSANPRIPSSAEIASARRLVGWAKVQRSPGRVFLPEKGMAIDLGGWGKEFAVDTVAQLGMDFGITSLLVDFGHDLRAIGAAPGKPAWHVGLENPDAPGTCWGSIGVCNASVASSGDYHRGFTLNGQRYGHIVDPRTGWPTANGCRQVTVVAPTCLQAGMLSTTAFVLGGELGIRLIQESMGAEGAIITRRARHQSRGFFRYVVEN